MNFGLRLLGAMKRNPRDGWTIDEIKSVCRSAGVHPYAPARGSHVVLSHPWVEGLLTIPAKRPIKPIYVQLVVDMVETVQGMKK